MRSRRPDPPSRSSLAEQVSRLRNRRLDWLLGELRPGGTMGLNLASIVTHSAARAPQAVAVRLGPLELTYAELDERSARLAALLREKGLQQGDRVGVMLPNVLEFPVSY